MMFLPAEMWWCILLRVPYRSLLRVRRLCSSFNAIILSRIFWEEKSLQDYDESYRFLKQRYPWSGYTYLISRDGHIEPGCEEHIPLEECLERSLKKHDENLLQYFYRKCILSDQSFIRAAHNGLSDWIELLPVPSNELIVKVAIFMARKRGHDRTARVILCKCGINEMLRSSHDSWSAIATSTIKYLDLWS